MKKIENMNDLINNEIKPLNGGEILRTYYETKSDKEKQIIDDLIGMAFELGMMAQIKVTNEHIEKVFNRSVTQFKE